MYPPNWRRLYRDRPPAGYLSLPSGEERAITIVIDTDTAYVVSRPGNSPTGLTLETAPGPLSVDGVNVLIGLLIGLPGVAPDAVLEHEPEGAPVPAFAPSVLTDDQARWRVEEELIVSADIHGIALQSTDPSSSHVGVSASCAWTVACALLSANIWHEAIPRDCPRCHIDLLTEEHQVGCHVGRIYTV